MKSVILLFGSIAAQAAAIGSATQTCINQQDFTQQPAVSQQSGSTLSFGTCPDGYLGPTLSASLDGFSGHAEISGDYAGQVEFSLSNSEATALTATNFDEVRFAVNLTWDEGDDYTAGIGSVADLKFNGETIWQAHTGPGGFPLTPESQSVVITELFQHGDRINYQEDLTFAGGGNGVAIGDVSYTVRTEFIEASEFGTLGLTSLAGIVLIVLKRLRVQG